MFVKGHKMKTLVVASLIALAFTTGFTCSKNAPEEVKPQEQMAAPAEQAPAAPAEGQPAAAPAEGQAAPAEGQTK